MEKEIIIETISRQAFPNSVSAVALEELHLFSQMILRFFPICDN